MRDLERDVGLLGNVDCLLDRSLDLVALTAHVGRVVPASFRGHAAEGHEFVPRRVAPWRVDEP